MVRCFSVFWATECSTIMPNRQQQESADLRSCRQLKSRKLRCHNVDGIHTEYVVQTNVCLDSFFTFDTWRVRLEHIDIFRFFFLIYAYIIYMCIYIYNHIYIYTYIYIFRCT